MWVTLINLVGSLNSLITLNSLTNAPHKAPPFGKGRGWGGNVDIDCGYIGQ